MTSFSNLIGISLLMLVTITYEPFSNSKDCKCAEKKSVEVAIDEVSSSP